MQTTPSGKPELPLAPHPTLMAALPAWLKIGLLSFGGPAGQIALMHQEIVERRRWISDAHFLHALNYCMLLPGPEAHQLSIYLGWLMHRTWGGVVAGLLFVLPGALLMLGISYAYVFFGDVPWLGAIFYGLKASVLALVGAAMLRIGGKILTGPLPWGIAAAAFAGIFFLHLPMPWIILGAMGVGWMASRRTKAPTSADDGFAPVRAAPSVRRSLVTGLVWLAIWMAPLTVFLAWVGPDHLLSQQAMFFSRAALITFGGAYSVLPYVAQQAVEVHGWLNTAQMMDGLALAETTPGPLILVLQFVGFMGGWQSPDTVHPALLAGVAAATTCWMTFVPSFLFIFVGAPFVEHTRDFPRLKGVLGAITAAVLGVILNLSIWFAWHVVVPQPGTFDPWPLVLALILLAAIRLRNMDALRVVAIGAAAGWLLHAAGVI